MSKSRYKEKTSLFEFLAGLCSPVAVFDIITPKIIRMSNIKNTVIEETKKEMVAAYKSGESVTSLSRNYSLSRTAIYFWIKSFV